MAIMAKMVWHRSRKGDLALRSGGLVCLLLSGGILALLIAHHLRHHPPGFGEIVLAMVGVVAVSAGGCLLLLGRHLFDEIVVSSRWGGRVHLASGDGADEPLRP